MSVVQAALLNMEVPPGPGLLQRSHTVGPGELKRSTSNSSFQRTPSYHQHQARSRRGASGSGGGGAKPTLEIYRPPSVRDGSHMNGEGSSISNRLNVHAKEFTMESLKMSKSSNNILTLNNNNNSFNNNNNGSSKPSKAALLQQSKSSGNIMHALQHQRHHPHQLQQSASIGNALQQSHRVHFRFDVDANADAAGARGAPPAFPLDSYASYGSGGGSGGGRSRHRDVRDHAPVEDQHAGKPLRSKTQAAIATSSSSGGAGIKRSKSMGSADALGGQTKDLPDFANFPPEVQAAIHRAVEDPNQVSARTLMQLVKHIMDRVVESRSFAEPAAKLCITIIEKEKNETFLESLLNTCQLWYQNREKYLKASSPSAGSSGSPSMRYPAFMAFLNEMYCQLKRRQLQLKTQYDGVAPGLLLLTLLAKCCQECLKPPSVNSLKEMECLFFVLSSIGKDLETELPARMNAVLAGVRDAFLTSAAIPAIRKTLLQLIELHAAQWQLPAPAIMYYYPATNK
ncbi:CBP80/20-dependent translation initiation factor [Frankliniella occidentalis]|uniref:CBP80/20-dependent translation initiation factor n=1 Tax=Frankliniella occidentalis TaxID=133901 RepID=A0A9C6XSF5_FRAOC|nr:CBP80/20-dependent translation initiation factor [Frankliniella occidentalis]